VEVVIDGFPVSRLSLLSSTLILKVKLDNDASQELIHIENFMQFHTSNKVTPIHSSSLQKPVES
jgi:hypothetical protein